MTARYSIRSESQDGIELYRLRDGAGAQVTVAPSQGNNCFEFQCGESVSRPVLEPVTFADFRTKPTSYGIPILFPFPNRIKDGSFRFKGKEYRVDPPRHGFVRDKSWKVTDFGATESQGAWLTSSFDAQDFATQILQQFPFPFRLEVTYRLHQTSLHMETRVENTGTREMPVGFGIHPYFRLPEGGQVTIPASQRWELQDSLPSGRLLEAEGNYDLRSPRDADGLQLDDIYTGLVSQADGQCRCLLTDPGHKTETVVEFDPGQFPHVVVYTPPAPRRALCIEPNTCPTDAFNLAAGGNVHANVITLSSGKTLNFHVKIYARAT